jgi:GntR family transcriptional regulator, vanillate catabolism transcriptional regulator
MKAVRPRPRKRGSPSPQIFRAVLRLRELILTGELAAGQRVAELKLVDTVGVSRTPLRLAMERLEHEGLLARRPAGGFIVREFTFKEVQDAIELRGALEGLACRFAAEYPAGPDKFDALYATLDSIDDLLQSPPATLPAFAQYMDLNEEFHRQLVELAANPLVSRLLDQVRSLPFASPSAFVNAHAGSSDPLRLFVVAQEQHRTIVEAISLRDSARAEALAREHARLALRNLDLAARDRDSFKRLPGGTLIRFA